MVSNVNLHPYTKGGTGRSSARPAVGRSSSGARDAEADAASDSGSDSRGSSRGSSARSGVGKGMPLPPSSPKKELGAGGAGEEEEEEDLQERIRRELREKRRIAQGITPDTGARRQQKGWNKKFLGKYNLGKYNLFTP